jgi:thioesterase domain-containing protein
MSEIITPRTNLEQELVRIWEQVLRRAPIGIQEDFFDLGGTSVQAARIFARIEETFHKRLPPSVIISASTIEQLAAALLPGKSREWKAYIVPIQSGGAKPALFCVGAGVSWRAVSEHLGPDQPVFSIELELGAVEKAKGPNPMEKLARHMVLALWEKQPRGPYYLCGYCQDGLFAYEVARQLTMYGLEVRLLALIETQNPFPHFRVRMVNGVRRNAMRLAFHVDQIRRLIRSREISEYVRNRRQRSKLFLLRMSSVVSPRFQLRVRQLCGVDGQEFLYLDSSFSKPKPLACPTAFFRCKDWPFMAAGDPYFGWREFLTGRSEVHEVPGDHEAMFREPSVRVLAEKLGGCLSNARQSETPSYDGLIGGDQTQS